MGTPKTKYLIRGFIYNNHFIERIVAADKAELDNKIKKFREEWKAQGLMFRSFSTSIL